MALLTVCTYPTGLQKTLTLGKSYAMRVSVEIFCIFTLSKVVSSASSHIHNIWRIRKYLTQQATEQIVHSFVTCRLDVIVYWSS